MLVKLYCMSNICMCEDFPFAMQCSSHSNQNVCETIFFATFLTDEAKAQRHRRTYEQSQKIQSGRTVASCIMLPPPQNCLYRKKKW